MPVVTHRPLFTRGLRATLVLAPVLPVLVLQGLAASAAPSAGPAIAYSDDPHPVSVTYAPTGAAQSFTVPAGVSSLTVTAVGAAGGDTTGDIDGGTSLGGLGAVVTSVVSTTPGDVLSVRVGSRGADNATGGAGGWNGGGDGGSASTPGAGGGGATDLRACSEACTDLASRLLVAAGGGGAGFYQGPETIDGGDAGAAAPDFYGVRGLVGGGGAGTTTTGGEGGVPGGGDPVSSGGPGSLGVGGVGGGRTGPGWQPGYEYRGAGGGGGGLYGGGGGADNTYYGAGGGGGSSLVPDGGTVGLAVRGALPRLTLTYDLGPVTHVDVEAEPQALPASGTATAEVTITPRTESGVPIADLTMKIDSSDPGQSLDPIVDNGDGTYATVLHGSTTVGTATLLVTVAADGDYPTGQATVETVAYTAPGIRATASSSHAKHGGWYRAPVTVTFTCTGTRLTDPCPPRVVLSSSGRRQVVTRTLHDDQGRSATSTTTVSIDRARPKVSVGGARNGATYSTKRKLTCKATDTLSGVASCKVTTRSRKAGRSTVVTWTGTAYDRAGNKATTTGRYTIRPR